MRTEPIYLTDPYRKSMTATILEILPEPAKRLRVLLDQTVFYPMGGGQPTDQGSLTWAENGQAKVYQVMMKEGEIWHYLEFAQKELPLLEVGVQVEGAIDWERRYQNMKVHTGGHLVDFALFRLGLVPEALKPLKADHGKRPYVLYEGTLAEHSQIGVEQVNQEVALIIEQRLKLSWEFAPLEKLQQDAIYLQPGLPTNKPLRRLTLQGVGSVADGGTLVQNTAEVSKVNVTTIEEIDGQVKISYQL